MNYIKYSIKTIVDAEDIIASMLYDMGIESVEIENNEAVDDLKQGGNYKELQPDLDEDDATSIVSFYLEEGTDDSQVLADIKSELSDLSGLMDIGQGTIEKSLTRQEDWANNWKEFFNAFEIEDILIKPTWQSLEEANPSGKEYRTVIEIDPGMSFGTGKHESTQLVIRQLIKYLKPGMKLLDVGCGSGILSIIALKLGASSVVGTDIDYDCIASTYDNFKVNNIDHLLGQFYVGNLTDDKELQSKVSNDYDIVVANILADIIIGMAKPLTDTLKPGSLLITSGIIDFKEEEVATALKAQGLEIVEINSMGEWRNITVRKN